MEESSNGHVETHRRSSLPKPFQYVGEDENGNPVWVDEGSEDDLDLLYPGTPSISEPEDDHHVANQEPKMSSLTDRLCAFCQLIPFDQIGILQGGQFLLRPFQHTARSLADVEEAASDGCILCSEISDTVSRFHKENPESKSVCSPSERDVTYSILKVGQWPATLSMNSDDLYQYHHLFRLGVSVARGAKLDSLKLWLSFQRCTNPPITIKKFMDEQLGVCDNATPMKPCDGRIISQQLDFKLLQWWLRKCDDQHGSQCTGLFIGPSPKALRFLDVEDCCIVDDPGQASYAALSYTWGTVQIPMMTTKNEAKYHQRGYLDSDVLPPTLLDAMEVTRQLGLRYIWIDCICMLQDSDADKAVYIPQMDSVYGYASITLVAASGENVNSGLAGVKQDTRPAGPDGLDMNTFALLRARDTLHNEPEGGYANQTKWSSRAWTLQEKLFSSRCLIFTKDQVYWACQKASWCEDGAWELAEEGTAFRVALITDRNPLPWTDNPRDVARVYADFVLDFMYRDLSFELDAANACTGALNALQRASGQDFLWGLPCKSLERGLDWTAYQSQGKPHRIRRRFDAKVNRIAKFPSWSWQGWKGSVEPLGFMCLEEGSFPPEKYATIGLSFYRLNSDDKPVHLPQAKEFNSSDMASFFGMANADEIGASDFVPDDVPTLPESVPRSLLLCFWTDTISANIYDSKRTDTSDCELELVEANTEGFVLNGVGISASEGSEADLIVVGRRQRLPEELAVLFVSWENGVAHRRGSLTVDKATWLAVENRVWKPIFLA